MGLEVKSREVIPDLDPTRIPNPEPHLFCTCIERKGRAGSEGVWPNPERKGHTN
jgi:hypothetical protein